MADTKLLLHFDGADQSQVVTDTSLSEHVVTCVGTAQLDTVQKVFGSASGLVDGNSDYFTLANHADWVFGTGDWTVDFRVRFNSIDQHSVFWSYAYASGFAIYFHHTQHRIRIYRDSVEIAHFPFDPATNTWYHIAVVRTGNNLMAFINGSQIGNTEDITGFDLTDQSSEVWIGRDQIGNNYYYNGWIEEFRVSKGIARWTSNFTPPTAEYPEGYKDLAGSSDAQSALIGDLKGIKSLGGLIEAQATLTANLIQTTTIELVATASTTIDPYFEFPSGTIEAKVNGISKGFFTSGVAKNIVVVDEDTIKYICDDWDAITVIDFWNSSVGGSVSGWILPVSLEELYLSNTSISGDISGWPDLGALDILEMYNSSIDYDNSSGSFEDARNGLGIEFWSCLLTEAQVDNVLLDLVTSAATNGTLDINGDNAAPSSSGLTSKATLVSRGWTVATTTAILSLAGLIAGVSVLTGNADSTQGLAGSLGAQSSAAAYLQFCYGSIPPAMHAALIDPYSGGAWLWLVGIKIPGYSLIKLARNPVDINYGGAEYLANNLELGLAPRVADGSVPRYIVKVAQDADYTLEDKINATEGAGGGTIQVIRAHEDFLDSAILELEQTISILTANSDTKHVIFYLGIPNPLMRKVPLRRYRSKVCPYALPGLFKGLECQYAGADGTCTGKFEDCYTKGNAAFWGAELGLDPNTARV